MQPGRELLYKIYMGEDWQYPRLTDTSTLNGSLTKEAGLQPVVEFKARSTSNPKTAFAPHYFDQHHQLVDWNERYVLLTPDDATDMTVKARNLSSRLPMRNQIYNYCELHFPLLFDQVRELLRRSREKAGYQAIETYRPDSTSDLFAHGAVHHPGSPIEPGQPDSSAPKAVIIAMHWLQPGGAERWAMETVALARKAGLLPIVITNNDSHQPWIVNEDLDDALVINLTFPAQEGIGDVPLLRALFEQYNIRGVMIHHNQWMYDRLWWIKRYYPHTFIVDSLHILEYHDRGGYPNQSVSRDPYIDLHHVISPQLQDWLVNHHGIAAKKVVMAPLVGLTADQMHPRYKDRVQQGVFHVAFVGRMTRQKRPEAFINVAKEMERRFPGRFRFIMHGSGDMDLEVRKLLEKYDLDHVVERRDVSQPVSATYDWADALLITSINEGITLTTIEAISRGMPVLSTDVGSQSTLVPSQGLLPRQSLGLVRQSVRSLQRMNDHEQDRRRLWTAELERLQEFSRKESADSFFTRMLGEWAQ
ncbi:glycosyltransferase [Bifidobacterium asteroides]|nr:glycosyltransferase [Bifidobacterium asteroides]